MRFLQPALQEDLRGRWQDFLPSCTDRWTVTKADFWCWFVCFLFSIYYFSLIKPVPAMINTVSLAEEEECPASVLTTLGRFASSDTAEYAQKELPGHKEGSDKNRVNFGTFLVLPNSRSTTPAQGKGCEQGTRCMAPTVTPKSFCKGPLHLQRWKKGPVHTSLGTFFPWRRPYR